MSPSRSVLAHLAAISLLALAAPAVGEGDPGLAVALEVRPAEPAGTYVVSLDVRRAADGAVLAAPLLKLNAGEPARVTASLDEGGELRLTVLVAGEREVRYGVELLRSGKPVSSQSGTVKLGG